MERFSLSEPIFAIGKFDRKDTVRIEVYNMLTNSKETVVDSNCTRVGSTGIFMWNFNTLLTNFNNIQNTSTTSGFASFLYIMRNQFGLEQIEWVNIGGYAEDSTRNRKLSTNRSAVVHDGVSGYDITIFDDNNTDVEHKHFVSGDKMSRTPEA